MFSRSLTRHETESEDSSPHYLVSHYMVQNKATFLPRQLATHPSKYCVNRLIIAVPDKTSVAPEVPELATGVADGTSQHHDLQVGQEIRKITLDQRHCTEQAEFLTNLRTHSPGKVGVVVISPPMAKATRTKWRYQLEVEIGAGAKGALDEADAPRREARGSLPNATGKRARKIAVPAIAIAPEVRELPNGTRIHNDLQVKPASVTTLD